MGIIHKKITEILNLIKCFAQMEECSFKNGWRREPVWCKRKRKGRSVEMKEIKKRKERSILQKKAQMVEKRVVEGARRGRGGRSDFKEEAREEEEEPCLHILADTLPKAEENREQKSDLMVDEEPSQETDSFHFLSLSQLEGGGKGRQEKGCKEEKSSLQTTLKEEKTCLNRFHILSSALSEELKYELYLVQNL